MKIQCPDCLQELRVDASMIGKQVRCPCGRQMLVGQPATQTQPVLPVQAQPVPQPKADMQDQDPDWPPPEYRDLFKSQAEQEQELEQTSSSGAPTEPGKRPTLRRQLPEAEKCRREYSTHEAGVINTGFYFILASVSLLMLAVPMFPDLEALRDAAQPELQKKAEAGLYVSGGLAIFSVFLWSVGLGVRNFQNWARILAVIVVFPLYFAFPVGSITAGFFVASLNSKEAKFVFSRKHRFARRQTPQLRPRHSAFSWIVAGIFTSVVFGIPLWLLCLSLAMR